MVEILESRQLLAATPVTAVTINGTAGQVTGIVLTFAVPLDAASAQNVRAYSVSKRTAGTDSSFGPIDTSSDGTTRRVHFQSAVYDAAAQTVTLTPTAPFDMGHRFRRLLVQGNGTNAVKDAAGSPIDGNGDGRAGGDIAIHSRVVRTSRFVFRERDGDTALLRLTGPGVMRVWADTRRNLAPVVFLVGTNAGQSTLTGTVRRGRRAGDGVVTIHEISGTSTASAPLVTDPAFHVDVVNP
jgi:hypothetical protein